MGENEQVQPDEAAADAAEDSDEVNSHPSTEEVQVDEDFADQVRASLGLPTSGDAIVTGFDKDRGRVPMTVSDREKQLAEEKAFEDFKNENS